MIAEIAEFVDKIANVSEEGRNIENPYRKRELRDNLLVYLTYLSRKEVDVMLIGEAPGYRGCALTGIPFTDERQLVNPLNEFGVGKASNYSISGERYEASATYIWEALRENENEVIPLMWNAYPFHPYKAAERQSNRTPSSAEMREGAVYIRELQKIFQIPDEKVYAIGRVAQKARGYGSDDIRCIRHPSYGGKNECQEKIRRIKKRV